MTAKRTKKQTKKGTYHHGDLRAALLRATRDVLARDGAAGLSLREVARQSGVTHAAPYRHFPDKASLLAALAEEAFHALDERMRASAASVGGDALAQLHEIGVAYVMFAVSEPESYRVMFGPAVENWEDHPLLRKASAAAMGTLVEHVTRAQASGKVRRESPLELASAAWAMTHGLAMGLIDGVFRAPVKKEAADAERFARSNLQLLLEGLASRA